MCIVLQVVDSMDPGLRRDDMSRLSLLLLTIILGIALLTLSLPRLRASIAYLLAENHLDLSLLNLGLRYVDSLEEDDLKLLRDQLLLTWRYKRREMKKSIASDSLNFNTIRGLIAPVAPEILTEMEDAYKKSH